MSNKGLYRPTMIASCVIAILAALAPQAVAQCTPNTAPTLYGTLGTCANAFPGGPCTQTSTLVQLDPWTGAVVKTIGPVGFTVNGLAWDRTLKKLFATTALGDVSFHGLITIDPKTGNGTPVNPAVINFGLAVGADGAESPVHSVTVDSKGNMAAWYDEFGSGVTDTFVRINRKTGVATEFPDTTIDSSTNGLSYSEFDLLWNIDTPKATVLPDNTVVVTQTAYLLNPTTGKPILTRAITPPTTAALGDFNPVNNLYFGLNFEAGPAHLSQIVVVDLTSGKATALSTTIPNLHTLAFVK